MGLALKQKLMGQFKNAGMFPKIGSISLSFFSAGVRGNHCWNGPGRHPRNPFHREATSVVREAW
jgi:hypothetical protein